MASKKWTVAKAVNGSQWGEGWIIKPGKHSIAVYACENSSNAKAGGYTLTKRERDEKRDAKAMNIIRACVECLRLATLNSCETTAFVGDTAIKYGHLVTDTDRARQIASARREVVNGLIHEFKAKFAVAFGDVKDSPTPEQKPYIDKITAAVNDWTEYSAILKACQVAEKNACDGIITGKATYEEKTANE